jgi:hypothetical protein
MRLHVALDLRMSQVLLLQARAHLMLRQLQVLQGRQCDLLWPSNFILFVEGYLEQFRERRYNMKFIP